MISAEKRAAKKARRLRIHRRNTMRDAHRVAKLIANLVGDYQIALSIALKFVYQYNAERKAVAATKDTVKIYTFKSLDSAAKAAFEPKHVANVPAWAIKKDFLPSSAFDILFYTINFETIKETEKAFQLKIYTKNPVENGYIDHHTTWVAKSIMEQAEKQN